MRVLAMCRCTVCGLSTSRAAISSSFEAARDESQDLQLARREVAQLTPHTILERRLDTGGLARGTQHGELVARGLRLDRRPLAPPERRQRAREPQPGQRRVVGRGGLAEVVERILVGAASVVMVSARQRKVAVGEPGATVDVRRADLAGDVPELRARRGRGLDLAELGARAHEQLERGHAG